MLYIGRFKKNIFQFLNIISFFKKKIVFYYLNKIVERFCDKGQTQLKAGWWKISNSRVGCCALAWVCAPAHSSFASSFAARVKSVGVYVEDKRGNRSSSGISVTASIPGSLGFRI